MTVSDPIPEVPKPIRLVIALYTFLIPSAGDYKGIVTKWVLGMGVAVPALYEDSLLLTIWP